MPTSFKGNFYFLLPLLPKGVPHAYGLGMDGMDNIYDGHAWCSAKTTNIHNEFGLLF